MTSRQLASTLEEERGAIVIINSFSYMLASLANPPELREWLPCYKHLELLVDEASDSVVRCQVRQVLERLSLGKSASGDVIGGLLRFYTMFSGIGRTTVFPWVGRSSDMCCFSDSESEFADIAAKDSKESR